MQILNATRCVGATTHWWQDEDPRQPVRHLRRPRRVALQEAALRCGRRGCDVSIIYSVSSRPVLSILRNPTGRGPIPMRQSVVTDSWGNLVKYNHSKWMTIIGAWGKSQGTYVTFSGSANWANLAFGDDEQMQRISSAARGTALQRQLREDVEAGVLGRAQLRPGGGVRTRPRAVPDPGCPAPRTARGRAGLRPGASTATWPATEARGRSPISRRLRVSFQVPFRALGPLLLRRRFHASYAARDPARSRLCPGGGRTHHHVGVGGPGRRGARGHGRARRGEGCPCRRAAAARLRAAVRELLRLPQPRQEGASWPSATGC